MAGCFSQHNNGQDASAARTNYNMSSQYSKPQAPANIQYKKIPKVCTSKISKLKDFLRYPSTIQRIHDFLFLYKIPQSYISI